ncbi:hypothetical protein H9Q72_013558 [Fusarium xylarioides]|uniref:AAA+ ATPase domain-containing protein n=1 Tax=Fusarium xylarioides TaxID=221167 RepID=A0A9P7KYM1_9HYPO|nr:hypothetical protein H9Q72_013558 [Fusarium xylarioides]
MEHLDQNIFIKATLLWRTSWDQSHGHSGTTARELQKLVGLPEVKESIEHIIDLAEANHNSHLQGRKPLPVSLNRCFLGAPGVGKTTVASLYSKILNELGLLSKGHVITKRASDLIGRYVGYSEAKVASALKDTQGGVLIIDDAHLFYQETSNGENDSDSYRQGIIDTLVANVSGNPGEDRCVILCGYPDKMERMFLKSNPGLARRFPLETALRFASYNNDELHHILKQKMDAQGIVASKEARSVVGNILSRMRVRPNFGNGGDVETLLSEAKVRQIRRLRRANVDFATLSHQPLEPIDFDPEFDRSTRAEENRNALFEEFVGFERITEKFQGYQNMARGMRRHNKDPKPHIPWTFIFKGPSGTGKTSTARKVGKLFYDMDFLASDEIVTCSVTNLIGEYKGHTGPKVINQLELSLGKVLFIDEAYRLMGDSFQKEAIGELVDAMTKPRYVHNMVVILAGYNDEMEDLLSSNPGLRSRFPTVLDFPQMSPENCLTLLSKTLCKLDINIPEPIMDRHGAYHAAVLNTLEQLTKSKGWASGRDVETLNNAIIELLFMRAGESEEPCDSEELVLSFEDLENCLKAMLKDRGAVPTRLWDKPN